MDNTMEKALEQVLNAYRRYYTISTENVTPPFQAEAVFSQHDERYFLSKNLTLSESDSREYAFFAAVEKLDEDTFRKMDETAWNTGLSRVTPEWGMQGADVSLVLLADHIDSGVKQLVKTANRTKSYAFSLKGWSNYQVIAIELSTRNMSCNQLGQRMAETLCKILF